jgi:hypothetical protein
VVGVAREGPQGDPATPVNTLVVAFKVNSEAFAEPSLPTQTNWSAMSTLTE